MTFGMPKSVTTSVKTTRLALMSPYFAPGSVMVRNLRAALVPSESAASYSRASAAVSAVIENHERMRENGEGLGDDDTGRTVDLFDAEGREHGLQRCLDCRTSR